MESQKQDNSSSEMDLGQFFAGIGRFFQNFFHSIIVGLANIRRVTVDNKWLFISLMVIGAGVGVVYVKYFNKKFYESTMILNSDYMNKRTVDNSINNLNLLAGETSKAGLMKTLNISDSLARNIMQFEAKPFIEEDDVVDLKVLKEQLKNSKLELENPKVIDDVIERLELENRHAFEIIVRLYNPDQFKGLELALVNFFKNNQYIKNRIEINRRNLLDRQRNLSHDREKLDSLKDVIYLAYASIANQNRQGSNNVILSDKMVEKPIDLWKQSLEIYDDLDEVNEIIYLHSDFEVVNGFAELNVPAGVSAPMIILISVLGAVTIGYLIVGARAFNSYLNKLA